MSWIEHFEDDIVALHQLRTRWPGSEAVSLMIEAGTLLKSLLEDSYLDPADLGVIVENWWSRFHTMEVDLAKTECMIQRRLAPLYERLQRASEEEWEAYARMIIRARFASENPLLKTLLESIRAE